MDALGVFLFWFVLCWAVGIIAATRERSGMGYFLLSFFLSPLVGFIVVLVLPNRKLERERAAERARQDQREHERQLEHLRAVTAAAQPTNRAPVAPSTSTIDDLERLAALRQQGILTDAEFATQKAAILARSR